MPTRIRHAPQGHLHRLQDVTNSRSMQARFGMEWREHVRTNAHVCSWMLRALLSTPLRMRAPPSWVETGGAMGTAQETRLQRNSDIQHKSTLWMPRPCAACFCRAASAASSVRELACVTVARFPGVTTSGYCCAGRGQARRQHDAWAGGSKGAPPHLPVVVVVFHVHDLLFWCGFATSHRSQAGDPGDSFRWQRPQFAHPSPF